MQNTSSESGANGAIDVVPRGGSVVVESGVQPTTMESTVGNMSTTMPITEESNPRADRRVAVLPGPPLGEWFERFVQIDQFTFPVGSPGNVAMIHTSQPVYDLLNSSTFAPKLRGYRSWRADVELEIHTRFSTGTYGGFVVTPFVTYPASNLQPSDATLRPSRALEPDGAFHVDAQVGGVFRLTLPWVHPYDYAQIAPGAHTDGTREWSLVWTQMAGLQSAIPSGVPNGDAIIFARFKPGTWEVVVPIVQGGPGAAKPSAVLRGVSKMAGALSALPGAGAAAGVVSTVAGYAADVAAYFGHSRDFAEAHATAMVPYAVQNVASTSTADLGHPLALIGDGRLAGEQSLLHVDSDGHMDFASVVSRPMLVGGFALDSSVVAGTVLFNIPVSPGLSVPISATSADMLAAGWCGMPFEFWRGDMVFRLRVYGSRVHRGALQVFWSPVPFNAADGPKVSAQLFNEVIDLADGAEHVFKVGFAQVRPYLQMNMVDQINHGVESINGFFCVRVLQPMLAQAPANYAYVRVWANGAPNLDFRGPNAMFEGYFDNIPHYQQLSNYRLEGGSAGALGDEEVPEACVCELFPASGDFPSDAVYFPGNGVRSVRALLQRPSARGMVWDATLPGSAHRVVRPTGPWDSGYTRCSWQDWYRAPYASIAGSVRVQVVANRECVIECAYGTGVNSGVSTLQLNRTGNSASFVVPWTQAGKFVAKGSDYDPVLASPGDITTLACVRAYPLGTAAGFQANVYEAYGDDVSVGPWRQTPVVAISPASPQPLAGFWLGAAAP